MSEHTKTPWTTKKATKPHGNEQSWDCAIFDPDGELIAETFGIVGKDSTGIYIERPSSANAAFIVRAANSFDVMRSALLSISRNTCCEQCTEAARVAQNALVVAGLSENSDV